MSMTNTELANKATYIANNYKTVYMWGTFGAPVSAQLISGKAKQYPDWYTTSKKNHFTSLIGKGYFAFDCVNLIKGILWGWSGDASKSHGGAKYPTADQVRTGNVIPDVSADGLIHVCTGVSTNFGKIEIGEAVWMPGHIGIYIGNGKVVECSPAWTNKVQITAVANIGRINGLNARAWVKHGKIPWVTYGEKPVAKSWQSILNEVSNSPADWTEAVILAMETAKKADFGEMEIFQYLGTLIEKIDALKYTKPMTWEEIIGTVATSAEAWKASINTAVKAASAEGDIGALEIFKYLPDLLVKVYNSNK